MLARSLPPLFVHFLLLLSLISAAAAAQGTAAAPAAPPALADSAGRSFRRVLTVGGAVGAESVDGNDGIQTLGVRVALARRPITGAPWSFPKSVEVTVLLTGDGDGGLGGILAVGGAVQAARRLGRSTVYLQPGFQLSVGEEAGYSVYDDGNRVFVGGRLGLELVRYPTRRGFVGGVGVYETRRFGSHIYNKRDVSLAVTLGAQF